MRVFFTMKVLLMLTVVLVASLTGLRAEDDGKAILILGDSLTAGYGLDPAQAYPAVLEEKIRNAGLDWWRVINAGVSGDTSAGGLRRIDWLLKRKVDILVLELGANDGLRGIQLDVTKNNLQQIIDRTRKAYPGVKIVIVGMMVPPNLGLDYSTQFRELFVELAEENQAGLIPFLLEGVAGRPELNLPDGIHPTAEGHKIIADTVWEILLPLLTDDR
jgi:acyl-CoA thioesterase-1